MENRRKFSEKMGQVVQTATCSSSSVQAASLAKKIKENIDALAREETARSQVEVNPLEQIRMKKLSDATARTYSYIGVGWQYEILVSAYFALTLNKNGDVKDFSIRSNVHEDFGLLNDVIIDVTLENGECLNFAIKLEHRGRVSKISPNVFEKSRGGFSLEKYRVAFNKLSKDIREKYHYILYTCQNFNRMSKNKMEKFTMLEDNECRGKMFFDTSSDKKSTYRFEINDETEEYYERSNFSDFFSKFTLYTRQKNVDEVENLILEILKERNVVNGYLNLFRKWHQGVFTNRTIDRKTINFHLVDIYLSSFMIMDYRLGDDENQKIYLFEKAAKEFDVTVVDESRENFVNNLLKLDFDNLVLKSSENSNFERCKTRYRMDPKSTLAECMLRLAKEYKFIGKKEMQLDEAMKKKIFSFYFQNLLIVSFNEYSAEAVYTLMHVYQFETDKIKIILLGHKVDILKLSSIQVFQNLEDLSRKDQVYQEIMKVCMISFQGQQSVTLKQLVESLDIKSAFETKEIVEMLKSDYVIDEEKIELPQCYIPRTVSTTVFDLETILAYSKNTKNVIILNGISEENETDIQNKAIEFVKIPEHIDSKVSFTDKSIILSTKEPNSEEIETICAKQPGKSIHAFKMVADDIFILTRSTSKFVCEKSNAKNFSQEELHSTFNGTLNLLVGEPGMGKTTLMKSLRNDCPWSLWPIFTELKSHSQYFGQAHTSEEILAYLTKTEPEESSVLQKLKEAYQLGNRLVLFLDGLDEVPRNCVENVLDAIGSLRDKCHLWVSSRQNLEERLLEKFNLFSLHMIEFCHEEQNMYIQNRLKRRFKKAEICKFIGIISESTRMINNTKFLTMPLELSILIEIILNEKKLDDIIDKLLVVTKLYKNTFRGRFQHSLSKYETHSPLLFNAAEYLENYEIAGLESILDEESFQKLAIDSRIHRRFLSKIEADKDALGVVAKVEQGRPIFLHDTYAEYFACVWFTKNQRRTNLLKRELFSERYDHLRLMLDLTMAEKNPLHLSIMYKNFEQFQKHIKDVDSIDEAGRTALHIACSFGTKFPDTKVLIPTEEQPDWYETMIERLFEKTSRFFLKDNLFKFDCLDYACASGCLYAMEVALRKELVKFSAWKEAIYRHYDSHDLIGYCVNQGYPNLLNGIITENPEIVRMRIHGRFLLDIAICTCCFNTRKELTKRYAKIVEILMDNGADYHQDITVDSLGSTTNALHLACKYGQFEVVEKILQRPGIVPDYDKNKKTALHSACECADPNYHIIILLIRRGFDINAQDNSGTTPFQLACRMAVLENVEILLKYEADLHLADRMGNNALHYASMSRMDNDEIIGLLIRMGLAVNLQNENGTTPLHLACREGTITNLKILLENGGELRRLDENEINALDYAMASQVPGREIITDFLVNHGLNIKKSTLSTKEDSSENKQRTKKNEPGFSEQYELNALAYFALKLNANPDVQDFSIQNNISEKFGNFADIIIRITLINGDPSNFALRFKHRENVDSISPHALETSTGKFSLEKHCAAFEKMPVDVKNEYHYILYTCINFDIQCKNEMKKFTMVEDDHCPGKRFFDTSSNLKKPYRFEVKDEALETKPDGTGTTIKTTQLDYQYFFSKFTLYACQKNFRQLEKLITETLKQQSVVSCYLTLFRKWYQGLFTNNIIDRKTINMHLADYYLSSFMILDYRLSDNENEKIYFFEKATKEFDATLLAESKENFIVNLKRFDICDNSALKTLEKLNFEEHKAQFRIDSRSTLTECMLRLAKEYKFTEKVEMELEEDTKKKMFCFCFQQLLMVDFNPFSAESVYKLIEIYQIKEKKIRFVFLGHGVDLSKLSSVQVFRNLDDLRKKNYQFYQELITQCVVLFHDRRSVSLNQLVEFFDEINSVFETKEIFEMLKTDDEIVEEKIEHYVPRNISTTVFDLATVIEFAKNINNIIIINGRSEQNNRKIQNEGIEIVKISHYIGSKQSFADKCTVLSTEEPNSEQIEDVCVKVSGKVVHVFKMIADDILILIRSTSELICEKRKIKIFSQGEIHSVFDGTINLLIAEPGMGKSTLMKNLRHECPWNFWAIYTDLKSHRDFFSRSHTNEEVIEHFMKTEPELSNCVKKLREVFIKRKNLVLFLDGLDELTSNCVKNVLNTVETLSHNMGYRVWISSRQSLEQRLSTTFHLFSLRIVEFYEEDQISYLMDRLKLVYQQEEFTEFFEEMRIFNKSVLGVPLHLRILTQTFLDERKHHQDTIENFFVGTKLYRVIFKRKFQQHFMKYECGAFLPDAAEYLELYEIPALESVLEEKSFQKLQVDCRLHRKFIKTIETERDALGIVARVDKGKAIFAHQSYAEYFACVWLKHNPEKLKLLKHELFSHDYEQLRFMFNMIMAENNPLHLSIINKNLAQFEKHIKDIESVDEGGRTALHIACCSGTRYLDNEVLRKWSISQSIPTEQEPEWYKTMIETLFKITSGIFVKDNLFDFYFFEYAGASGCLYAIEVALRKKLIMPGIWKQAIYKYHDKSMLVGYCMEHGYLELLQEIVKNNPEVVNEKVLGRRLFDIVIQKCPLLF